MNVRKLISDHCNLVVWLVLGLILVPVTFQILRATVRLLGWTRGHGGIDLGFYHRWTHEWFSGNNIYVGKTYVQGYPPASILLLYPFTGLVNMDVARWIWMFLTIGSFSVVAIIGMRSIWVSDWQERVIVLLLLLLNNGTSVTYENGQASLYVLALTLGAVLILQKSLPRWRTDLFAAFLFTNALLKPNLSLPFVWLLFVFPTTLRARPLLLVSMFYLALSLWSAALVGVPLPELVQQFLGNRLSQVGISPDPNLHFVFAKLGLEQILLPVSGIIWLAVGVYIMRYRASDLWLLLGITALAARFWGFHWIYDNVLLFVAEIALLRIWKQGNDKIALTALLLLALNVIAMLPPGNLGGQAEVIRNALMLFQAGTWAATLGFLIWYTHERGLPLQEKLPLIRA